MAYIKVADIAELPANSMKVVIVDGKEVLLANVDVVDTVLKVSGVCNVLSVHPNRCIMVAVQLWYRVLLSEQRCH